MRPKLQDLSPSLSNDLNNLEALTTGPFLISTRLNTLPEPIVEAVSINRLDQQLQKLSQTFWRHRPKE